MKKSSLCFCARCSVRTSSGGKRRIQTELSHGFRFVADCFGEGREMILLVSALTRTPNALTYIGRHGCEPYLHYAQALMYRQQEAALQQACREVL